MTRKNMSAIISRADLREVLDYDAEAGKFKWRDREGRPSYFANREPGTVGANGRLYIGLNGKRYLAHRLAWFYVKGAWPKYNVVPANGDYLDLRFSNLKEELPADTARKSSRRLGESGMRGVVWSKDKAKWRAEITVDYKNKFLGYFNTKEEAQSAYLAERAAIRAADSQNPARREALRVASNWRRLWRRTLKAAGGATGWESIEDFIVDIGEFLPNRSLEPANPETKIGPGNWQWLETLRGQFDQSTREGRIAYDRAHRTAFPDAHRDRSLKKYFGITFEQYSAMHLAQDGRCAICRNPETEERNGELRMLCVDHCHKTGAIRGLLCGGCNRAIGNFRDSPELMEAGAAYIRSHTKSG